MLVVTAVPVLISNRQATTLPSSQPAFPAGCRSTAVLWNQAVAQHKQDCILRNNRYIYAEYERADERTRTAFLISLRVNCSYRTILCFTLLDNRRYQRERRSVMRCNERLTFRDPGPTEQGRDASALQLHLKDAESSLS
jgi:hypothetical protein